MLFEEHRQALNDALDVAALPASDPDNIGAFPDQQARLFDIPDIREGLLDIYALRECQITSLIAQRNNQLGKVAPPSQRWLYELELWRRLNDCWHSDVPESLDNDDRDRLQRLIELKTQRLPKASWNALFGSSEWADSFSRASEPLAPQDSPPLDASLEALDYLRRATLNQFDPGWQPESSVLEGHLQTLQRTPLSARILRALQLAALRLEESRRLIDTALKDVDECPLQTADAPLLDLVRQRLMPYLQRLSTDGKRWLTAINALLEAHSVSRPAIDAYRREWLSLDAQNAPWQRFMKARKQHETSWQRLLSRCHSLATGS
ncbi:DUF3080 family protein [Aidingimonas lacisalsi]|uniref:DUF3080 family protein n=1 Tax=Aidingimonas lacisalsi TaxID=2604086 RepID=UPI001F1A8F04|nr:DUF3080 family protein [Aidingimonas lacisalsi]